MKGLQKFGQRGRDTAYKEMEQLHNQIVFEPINIIELTELEKKRTKEVLFFQ
jgi:hypothetical protein